MRKFRRLRVPTRAHPLIKSLYKEMNHQCIGICDMADRSGVNKNTIKDWKHRAVPSIINLEACFTVLGLKLTLERDNG